MQVFCPFIRTSTLQPFPLSLTSLVIMRWLGAMILQLPLQLQVYLCCCSPHLENHVRRALDIDIDIYIYG